MHRRELLRMGLGAAGALGLGRNGLADDPVDDSDPAPLIAKIGPMMTSIPIEVANLSDGFDLMQGPGGNIAVLRGPDELIVVDSGVPVRGKELLETAKKVGGKPVSTLINTHWHFDHAGGNEFFSLAGARLIATAATRKRLSTDQYTEVFKMTTPAAPPAALPVLTLDEADLHVGADTIHLTSVPPAHTDGDLIIHFTSRDVIHTGDLFTNGFYPNIDASSLGWIGGMIAAADRILALAGPKTRIIPGHGAVATSAEVAAFRKMLVAVYDRLSPMVDAGKSTKEAIAARPLQDLDATWAKGFFNSGMFTRIVYEGLLKRRANKP